MKPSLLKNLASRNPAGGIAPPNRPRTVEWLAATPQKWVAAVSVVMCFNTMMQNDPKDNVDVPADDELSDETLDEVSGGSRSSSRNGGTGCGGGYG